MAETLERSVLERKERDELATIATALGMKPSSRAKKETLIDQILKTAGVGASSDAPAAASSGSEGAAPSRRPRQRRTASADASMFDPFAEADAAPAYDPRDEEAALDDRASRDGAEPEGESAGGEGGRREGGRGRLSVVPTPSELAEGDAAGGDRTERSDRGERGERRERNRDRNRDRQQGDRPQGERGQGGQNQGGQNQGGQQGQGGQSRFDRFEGEGGRRNRRRRGRDRDRQVSPERDAQADRISETYQGELIEIEGLLDISDQGYGYIRANGYLPSPRDVYVPVNRVKQLGLRKGDRVAGAHRPATPQEKFPAIVRIDTVNGHHPDVARLRPKFEELTPLFPDNKLRLEQPGQPGNMVARIIDLVSPIGKGQRGLIVSPPKAGKTTIMKQIASSIEMNNPEVHLMVLLIDERPEEVTDMRRTVRGEVIASTFDKPADEHTVVAELAIERAKRLVEEQKDVVIILDGITRLARAYNLAAPATGRIMSGGIDTGALYPPKKFFGAARNVEEGGSLTILATALIETGSTMDTVIFEEFKGTGNMELRLDRRLAEKRVYPAINVNESSTRHEELLFERPELEAVWKLRRVLNGLAETGTAAAALELLMDRIKTTRTNNEFLLEIAKAPGVAGN